MGQTTKEIKLHREWSIRINDHFGDYIIHRTCPEGPSIAFYLKTKLIKPDQMLSQCRICKKPFPESLKKIVKFSTEFSKI